MNSLTDQQLLRDYTGCRSEAAFAELVRRHVDLVYSAALRMVCDAHLAQDVTQGAFVALAQNARQLADHPVLSGWLHRTAQNLAANIVRSEVRRRAREQEAAAMNQLPATESDAPWEIIAPYLDAALGELNETERDAVLLRYFERKSAGEMAQILGTSEDAAQKRVSRAVERLREFFSKRNVTVGAGGLAVLISANAVQSAPVGLATTISAAAVLTGTAISTSTVIAATKTIAMTTIQKTLITTAIAAAVGTGIFEARQSSQLRERNDALAQQITQLQTDNEGLSNRLAEIGDSKKLSDDQFNELLRLRGEVGVLRRQKNELQNSLAQAQSSQPRYQNPNEQQQTSTALSEDYPKTPDAATKGIFDALAQGNWDAFLTNYTESGVPPGVYEQMFTDEAKSNFVGMEVVSIGQPTNWLSNGSVNKWFVPYEIRFKDGSVKRFRLSVGQDTSTGRFYFDGGL